MDLAEVNGRTFVNNVSLGVYAEAVQREGYRNAKLRTILDTAPRCSARASSARPALDRAGRHPAPRPPDPGLEQSLPPGPWRSARAPGPRLDEGLLGLLTRCRLGANNGEQPSALKKGRGSGRPRSSRSAPTLPVAARHRRRVGQAPATAAASCHLALCALRVRIAPQHPGASPSAMEPDRFGDSRARTGRDRRPVGCRRRHLVPVDSPCGG